MLRENSTASSAEVIRRAGQDIETVGIEDLFGLDLVELQDAVGPTAGDDPDDPSAVDPEPGDDPGRPALQVAYSYMTFRAATARSGDS